MHDDAKKLGANLKKSKAEQIEAKGYMVPRDIAILEAAKTYLNQ